MKEITGTVFSVANDNPPIQGCTISKEIYQGYENYITHFSLAEKTDISAELYEYHKLIVMLEGDMAVTAGENFKFAKNGKHYVKANSKFKMALLLTLE